MLTIADRLSGFQLDHLRAMVVQPRPQPPPQPQVPLVLPRQAIQSAPRKVVPSDSRLMPLTPPCIYPLIGESNSRKSTTVRCLTGAPTKRERWEVKLTFFGVVEMALLNKSAPEAGLTVEKTVEWTLKVRATGVAHILIPLRLDSMTDGVSWFPKAFDYLSALGHAGWHIHRPVVLGAPFLYGWHSIPNAWHTLLGLNEDKEKEPRYIPNAYSLPSNDIARVCREVWGIV